MVIRPYICFIETISFEPIYYETFSITKEDLEDFKLRVKIGDFLAENPMPSNNRYKSIDDLFEEFVEERGIIVLPLDYAKENPDFVWWLADLLDLLLRELL